MPENMPFVQLYKRPKRTQHWRDYPTNGPAKKSSIFFFFKPSISKGVSDMDIIFSVFFIFSINFILLILFSVCLLYY